ncbi:MAG: 4Fe-4S dicluster domain-containing protein [Planctomycetota bacterium]
MAERVGMLIDVTKCIACRACQVACKQWNQLPATVTRQLGTYQNPPHLNGTTWTLIQFVEPADGPVRWLFRKEACKHCGDPTCVQVCPTGACRQRPDGIVEINPKTCAGCKYCVETCPFSIPKPDPGTGNARKCRMCLDRVDAGLKPACTTACLTGAIQFGTRAAMLAKAQERKAQLAKEGHAAVRIYGENELGGLGVMYVLPESAETYLLPDKPQKPTVKIFVKWLMGLVPGLALLMALGVYLWKDRTPKTQAEGK